MGQFCAPYQDLSTSCDATERNAYGRNWLLATSSMPPNIIICNWQLPMNADGKSFLNVTIRIDNIRQRLNFYRAFSHCQAIAFRVPSADSPFKSIYHFGISMKFLRSFCLLSQIETSKRYCPTHCSAPYYVEVEVAANQDSYAAKRCTNSNRYFGA